MRRDVRGERGKDLVERYIAGFNGGDHELILACLTDDVACEMVATSA